MKNNVLYIAESRTRHVDENIRTLSLKYTVNTRFLANEIGKIKSDNSTIVQHTKPHKWEYLGDNFNHVGVLDNRCDALPQSHWKNRLKLVDTVVSTRNITGEEVVMPVATDINKYFSASGKISRYSPNFTFYTISSASRVDNLSAIIKAFHLEFRRSEPVDIVIFIKESLEETRQFCDKIKDTMRLYANPSEYKKEIIIKHDENNIKNHLQCDAYIGASYATTWNFAAFDAMCFGKTPIVNNCAGYNEFINDKNGYLVKTRPEPTFGLEPEVFDIDTSYTSWYSIDVLDLRAHMRRCYEEDRKDKIGYSLEDSLKYDYGRIFPIWEKVIENVRRTRRTGSSSKSKEIQTT